MKKNQNVYLSITRIFLCIAVLLYHLGILNGGYLAVNSFFVLAGYLGTVSLCKNKSIISHYLKRLYKIYLPLIIIVFSTLGFATLLKINLFNVKPEITSILLGYNNFWQITANVDYFAKHVNSPYMHLWYISILMQIELVFPILFIIINKIGSKTHKIVPFIILSVFAIISILRFCTYSLNGNIMMSYYDTLSRLYPFILGAIAGLYKSYNAEPLGAKLSKKMPSQAIYGIYLVMLSILFIAIPATSNLYIFAMILVTIITIRLIDHSFLINKNYSSKNTINSFSNFTYEIYLLQYPIIYFANYWNTNVVLKNIAIILVTVLLSSFIHASITNLKNKKNKVIHILAFILVLIPTVFGAFIYANTEDNTKEIEKIKNELEENRILMEKKQKEILEKQAMEKAQKEKEEAEKQAIEKAKKEKEEAEWNEYINSLYKSSGDIEEYVSNLKIVGVGDSVMLDSIPGLYKEFPNGYFDAKVSRSTYAAYEVLKGIKDSGFDWDILVFNLGTNGETYRKYKDNLMDLAGNHDVFWLTATTPDYPDSNEKLIEYAKEFDNIHILDWAEDVKDHPEYLYKDYTHLKPAGIKFYTQYIKDKIVDYYIEKQNKEIEEIIKKHKDEVELQDLEQEDEAKS